jgi:signal transduction histidine kinase
MIGDDVVGRVWSFRDVSQRERLLRRATFLSDASQMLASLDLDRALRAVAKIVVPEFGERCAIDLIQEGAPTRAASAGGADDEPPVPDLHPSVLAGHPTIYTAASRSQAGVPLLCRDTVVGAVTVVAPAGRTYAAVDLELFEDFARRIALSVDNAWLYDGARRALASRDEFLSIAAHEIRGPLTSLHMAVQGLLRGTLSATAAQTALDVIQREDRRLSQFVDELLDLGRIRTGQMHFHLEEVDLGKIIPDAVSRVSSDAANVESLITVKTEGQVTGQWDRFRVEQVLTNLLTNAVKYGEGKPIEIGAVRTEDRVTITVTDHGIGIEPEMLAKVFDPYQRAVAARNYGGLGLGLHIAKTIVEGMGGTIAVDSQPGHGSTFTVELPVSRSS